MSDYPTAGEVFGPGENRRLVNYYDAIRVARSEQRYEPDRSEPDTREVAESAYMPLEAPVSPQERSHGDG